MNMKKDNSNLKYFFEKHMPKSIETLLSPLSAVDKPKGAMIALAIFVMEVDKSIGKEEVDLLDTLLEKYNFGDTMAFAQFVASAKGMAQNCFKDEPSQDLFIQNCVKNVTDKKDKLKLISIISNMGEVNKKLSTDEAKIIVKIQKLLSI